MKNKSTLILFCLLAKAFSAFANPGDTTRVRSHDRAHWSWYGNIDQTATFPSSPTTYQQILLHYKLGCPAPRCSDWDYTTKIELLIPTGQLDSLGNAIKEPVEVARVMTPYGHNYDQNWQNEWLFDVTDYAPLLRGDVEVRAFYGGWSDGFLITLDFDFIEGTPARPVLSVKNLYSSGGNGWHFGNPTNPIEQHLPARTVTFDANMQSAKVRFVASGHGFNNAANCAEFCEKYYILGVDGAMDLGGSIWRNDCGNNSLYPQQGTWLYNRANWCPGDKTLQYDHDITDYITAGGTHTVDIDLDNTYVNNDYINNPAYYIVETQLIQYGAATATNDVALDDIIAPNSFDGYRRINPVCSNPIIKIRNKGSVTLTSASINYGIKGGQHLSQAWSGSLEPNETANVTLNSGSALFNNVASLEFEATVNNPNGSSDDNIYNNTQTARFAVPPTYNNLIYINLKNNIPLETSWRLLNSAGVTVRQRSASAPNAIYRDTLRNLPTDCYTLRLTDAGCDGLYFFANSSGTGYLQIKDVATGNVLYTVADFGCSLSYNFTVGFTVPTESMTAATTPNIKVYPNPTSGLFTIDLDNLTQQPQTIGLRITNAIGQEIQSTILRDFAQTDLSLRLPDDAPLGIYTLSLTLPNGIITRKISKQ